MKRLARIAVAVIVSTLALPIALPASTGIYKWKDKDGTMHFSDLPPARDNVTTVSPPAPAPVSPPPAPAPADHASEPAAPTGTTANDTAKPANAAPTAAPAAAPGKSTAERDLEFRQRRAAVAEEKAKADKNAAEAARRADACERARSQHAALTKGQRIVRPTADGGREFLNADDRAAETGRAQEQIDAFCN
jgi:hypothetical protein